MKALDLNDVAAVRPWEQTAMEQAEKVSIDPSLFPVLPGHTYADSYMIRVARALDARGAAEAAFAHPPTWIARLLALRNLLVKPLGLKSAGDSAVFADDEIGRFPVVSESDERIVLGFNDKHLDFRIVVDCRRSASATWVIASTLVKTHNLLGRTYLRLIMPFHHAVVKAVLRGI
jgi:hypothetical protein